MIEILKHGDIQTAMETNHRQYLIGDLKLPQSLQNLQDGQVELGLTHYDSYACEKPHFHEKVTEYQLMLKGKAKYVDLGENRELLVEEGDVFIIRPHTSYIQKSPAGTQILFFKCPGGNDKQPLPVTPRMEAWAADWDRSWEEERG